MSVMTVMPRERLDWTVDDLADLPDDGLQYELLDGLLLVSPSPTRAHQRLVGAVYRLLHARCPETHEVFVAPLDWRPDDRTSLQPDVLVEARADSETGLLLAVEVLSPSTRRKDLVFKRSKYEDAGVPNFWVVDPEGPVVTVFELRDGTYAELGSVTGDGALAVQAPYPVEIRPATLA